MSKRTALAALAAMVLAATPVIQFTAENVSDFELPRIYQTAENVSDFEQPRLYEPIA